LVLDEVMNDNTKTRIIDSYNLIYAQQKIYN